MYDINTSSGRKLTHHLNFLRIRHNAKYYIYLLAWSNGTYYVGCTSNMKQRLKAHLSNGKELDYVNILTFCGDKSLATRLEGIEQLKAILKYGRQNVLNKRMSKVI